MTDEPEDKPINPFEAAMRDFSVNVSLRTDDVLALKPGWSEARAKVFLAQYASVLASAMLSAGTEAMSQLLEPLDDA